MAAFATRLQYCFVVAICFRNWRTRSDVVMMRKGQRRNEAIVYHTITEAIRRDSSAESGSQRIDQIECVRHHMRQHRTRIGTHHRLIVRVVMAFQPHAVVPEVGRKASDRYSSLRTKVLVLMTQRHSTRELIFNERGSGMLKVLSPSVTCAEQ